MERNYFKVIKQVLKMNSYDYNCLRKQFISIVIQISFSSYEFFVINKKYLFKLKKINFIDFME